MPPPWPEHREALDFAAGDAAAISATKSRMRRDRGPRMLHVAEVFGIDHQIGFRLTPVQQQMDPMAELERRGVKIAGGPQVDRRVRHRRSGAIAIALREDRFVVFRQHEAAGRHAGRLEDLSRRSDPRTFSPRDLLDQVRCDAVAGIRVRHARAGLPAHDARARVDLQHLSSGRSARSGDVVDLVEMHVVETGGVLQQVDDAHRESPAPRRCRSESPARAPTPACRGRACHPGTSARAPTR